MKFAGMFVREVVPGVLDDLCERLDIDRTAWVIEHREECDEVGGRTLVDVCVVNDVPDVAERGGGAGLFQEGSEARFDNCAMAENIDDVIMRRHGVNIGWLLLVDLITATEMCGPVLRSSA